MPSSATQFHSYGVDLCTVNLPCSDVLRKIGEKNMNVRKSVQRLQLIQLLCDSQVRVRACSKNLFFFAYFSGTTASWSA
jgi:hypothetical protein